MGSCCNGILQDAQKLVGRSPVLTDAGRILLGEGTNQALAAAQSVEDHRRTPRHLLLSVPMPELLS